MQIHCPHCQIAIELVDAVAGSDLTCPKCGSRVSSVELARNTPTVNEPSSAELPPTIVFETPAEQSADKPASSTTPAAAHQRPPMIEAFGRFQLLERLGSGSFGEVYRAYDPSLDRKVALKRPHRHAPPRNEPEAKRLAEEARRFLIEAQAAAQLKHPHIVGVYEVGEIEGRPYFTSEYIRGIDLAELIKREKDEGRLIPVRQVAKLCGQVAEALHAAHEVKIVHRDLKPANIIVGEDDLPRVMDFGMAKRESAAEFVITQAGAVLGSPAYMSPEQWQDSSTVDRATDIWSLGVMLFELLTGEFPFRASRDFVRLKEQILNDDPPPPSQLNSQVPADLDTLCLKCLEKDPSRRFPTAAALAQELHRFLHGEPIHSRPITQWERASKWCQRNPAVASLSAAVVLVLLTGTAVSSFFAFQSAKDSKRANAKADEARLNLYDAHMNLIQRNWEIPQVGLVLDSLEKTRPQPGESDLRGFEWHYWNRLCYSSLLDMKGHTDGVTSVAFSADGKWVASASFDGTVKVWNATSGHETLTLKGHTDRVTSVAFSADGKRLASASEDQTVKVWDATTGQETHSLKGHTGAVMSVAFSADGKRLASASGGIFSQTQTGEVKVWDAASGQETLTLKGHTGGVTSVAFSADGKRLASASNDQTLKVWDATSGREVLTLKGHTKEVTSVAFSADGKWVASASFDGTVKVWDTTNGQEKLTLKGHTSFVMSVAMSADGKRLASASFDGTVKVWDVTSSRETLTLKGHTSVVWSVAFSVDGQRIVSGGGTFGEPGEVKVWNATNGQEALTLKGHTAPVLNVAFSADGKRLASASDDETVKVWDSTSGQETLTLKGHAAKVTSVAFSADGKRLASASWDETVKLWDAMSGQETLTLNVNGQKTLTLKFHTSVVWSVVAFNADGKPLASSSGEYGKAREVKVWDAASRQATLTLKGHTDRVTSVAFSADGKRLASASEDQTVKVWDATTGQETHTLKGHTKDVTSVSFSADGKRLASASEDRTVKVWDATSGQETLTLKGHTDVVTSVAFSADGKRLASASEDQTVKVWDTTSGQETLTLKGHSAPVWSVAFSADGQRMASASNDGTVKVWDARPWTPELRAEREALSLIHILRAHDQSQSEWLNAISSDQTISEPVRQRALQFAREWK